MTIPNHIEFTNDCHTVYWGDAISVLEQSIPNLSIDLIFADPPFNIGKQFAEFEDKWPSEKEYVLWCEQWLELCIAKLKPAGSIYVMASTQSMPYLDFFLRERITIKSRIVWSYDSSGVQAKKYYGSMYEPIIFGVKNENRYTFNLDAIKVEAKTGARRKLIDYRKAVPTQYNTQKVPGNVWEFPRVRYRMDEYEEHPSQKPESLLTRIILASSNKGDVVLDPFSGTFTTSAVAKKLGRKSIGIELQEEYVKIALRRLEIQSTWKGEPLAAPVKTYIRKNGKSSLKIQMSEESAGLFEGIVS